MENAFEQQIDNPLQFNSHAFDHTITVDKNVRTLLSTYPDIIEKVKAKYNINEE
jgi:hypothetical protein